MVAEGLVSSHLLRAGLLALLPYPFLLVAYWRWLRPQLRPAANRLAYCLWGCQLLLLLLHFLTATQAHQYSRFLWHINTEFNAPSGFATLQLALVASQALALARAIRPQAEWRYWLGVSAFFFLLALDEHTLLHEWGDVMELFYLLSGALLAGFTWRWLARAGGPEYARLCSWVIIGLALSAIGAVLMDRVAPFCPTVAEDCAPLYLTEEVLEYSGILIIAAVLREVALRALPDTRWPAFGRQTVVALGLIALAIYGAGRIAFPLSERAFLPFRPPILKLSGATVAGLSAGEPASVQVQITATQDLPARIGYSLQLFDPQTDEVWAALDQWSALAERQWPVNEAVSQTFSLTIPEDTPLNRALWLVLFLWIHDGIGYWNLPFYGGEFRQITESQVLIDEVILTGTTPGRVGEADVFAPGFELRAGEIPQRASAGETIEVTFHWQARTAGREDWQQFLHFTHEESGALWNHDQPPLGERLPTRLWYAGLADSERWQFTLPGDLAPGRYQVHTGLYRLADGQRAPARDASGRPWPEGKVALGVMEVVAP